MDSLAYTRASIAAIAIVTAVACDQPFQGNDGGPDARIDARVVYDALIPCERDEDCDDGVSCTEDACTDSGYCRNSANPAACDDGIFCNGVERCVPSEGGCVPAAHRETCNDHEVCTIDRCDEETRSCLHLPRDLDGDGDVDFFCAGGGDCDDRDSTVSSLRSEVCGDFVDNDCDGQIDEASCGRPLYDLCSEPLDVSEGGFFALTTAGANPDYPSSCMGAGGLDLVAVFTLTEPRSVDIEAEGDFLAVAVSLRTTCNDGGTEIGCHFGFPAKLQRRSLDPGTYFLHVASPIASDIALFVEFGDPLPPEPNDTCESPTDVSHGGTFTGSTVDVGDETALACGVSGAGEVFYTFVTTEERDVVVTAQSRTGESMGWALRSDCADAASDLRCAYGAPATGRIHQLPPGRYFLVVEGPSWTAVEFTVQVQFLDPTPPAPGDTCDDPLEIPLNTPFTGTLVDKEDDDDVSCSFHYREAVHSFTLDDAADVTVTLDTGTFGSMSIRPVCEDGATQLRCVSGEPAQVRLLNVQAGTYFVLAEAWRAGGYTLRVDTAPPTVPDDVSGNDDCTTAYELPPEGGYFRGTTVGLTDDFSSPSCGSRTSPDAVFRLTLPTTRRVVLSTEGSTFDTVLQVLTEPCAGGGELVCNDDGGGSSTSFIDRTFGAGTYFIVVDGFGMSESGEYFLQVTVSDP